MNKLKNIVLATASFVIFANIANAQAVKASHSVNAEEPLKVKYLGEDGEYLLFRVTLESNDRAKTSFAIEDKNEGQVYMSGLASNLQTSTVKIEKTSAEQVLDFKLSVGKKTYVKSFSVNTSFVEKTVVSEADVTKL